MKQATVILPKNMTDAMRKAFTMDDLPGTVDISGIMLGEIITALKHVRIFISTKQKMHPDGIKLHEELITFLEDLGKENNV